MVWTVLCCCCRDSALHENQSVLVEADDCGGSGETTYYQLFRDEPSDSIEEALMERNFDQCYHEIDTRKRSNVFKNLMLRSRAEDQTLTEYQEDSMDGLRAPSNRKTQHHHHHHHAYIDEAELEVLHSTDAVASTTTSSADSRRRSSNGRSLLRFSCPRSPPLPIHVDEMVALAPMETSTSSSEIPTSECSTPFVTGPEFHSSSLDAGLDDREKDSYAW